MDIYVAVKRIRFDVDEVIGVFSDMEKAESAIASHLIEVKNRRNVTSEELLFTLAASWEVDTWTVDTNTKKDNYGLTETLILELITKMESA